MRDQISHSKTEQDDQKKQSEQAAETTTLGPLKAFDTLKSTPSTRQAQQIRRKAATQLSQQIGNRAFIQRVVVPNVQRQDPGDTPSGTEETVEPEPPKIKVGGGFLGGLNEAYASSIVAESHARSLSDALEIYNAGAQALAPEFEGTAMPGELIAEGHKGRAAQAQVTEQMKNVDTHLASAKSAFNADNPE